MSTEKLKGDRRLGTSFLLFSGWAKGICCWSLFVLFGILVGDKIALASSLDLTGNWQYYHTENGDSQDSYLQNYNFDFSKDITEAMVFNGSMRYNRNENEGRVTEILYPTLDFVISNDIFRFDLSGTATENRDSEGSDLTDNSWETRLYSEWNQDWWPGFRLYYGEGRSKDDQSPRTVNTDSTQMGIDVDWNSAWDIAPAKAFYSYYRTEGRDRVTHSENTSDSHFARLQFNTSTWDNRIALSFSQQFNYNHQEFKGPIGTPRPCTISECMAGVDTTPGEGTLLVTDESRALVDNDLRTSALEIGTDEEMNIGVRVDSHQRVDLFYFYTVDRLRLEDQDFRWELWVSENGSDWDQESTDLTFIYNSTLSRFEIEIPGVEVNYLKLVTTHTPTDTIAFSEVQVMRRAESEKEENDYTDYVTDIGLGFRLATDLNLNYNLSLDFGKSEYGDSDRRQDRRTQTGSLAWTPSRYFSPSLSASEYRQDYDSDDQDDNGTLSRSYSFRIASDPLSTLDLSMGITRSENYESGDKQSTTDNYNLYITAILFPDLDTDLDLNYSTTDNVDEENSRSYGVTNTITARLSPKLIADLTSEYSKSEAESDTTSKSSALTLIWRPSDIFSLRGSSSFTWEDEDDDQTNYKLVFNFIPTHKTQVSLTYSYADSTTTTESYSVFWSWEINRIFSVYANGSYRIKEDNEPWSINGQLTARFSAL